MEFFLHLFTPRQSNNHRARLLHPAGIASLITALLIFQIFLTGVSRFGGAVLGYATNITIEDLWRFTNSERAQTGKPALKLNDQLSAAAAGKARDMFTQQYWAHTGPKGEDPWKFITGAGYNYLYAGENLARDFADSRSVVTAWMNSPTHRENVINSRYNDVGYAVVNGKYGDYETTLVVQMFGTRTGENAKPAIETRSQELEVSQATASSQLPASSSGIILNTQSPPKIDVFRVTKNVSLGLTLILMAVLGVDALIVFRRQTVRLSGHSLAHMMFLIVLLVALNLIGRGAIL